jgi:type I restriction enzyme S subunit
LPYVYYNLQYQNFIDNDAAVPGLNRKQAHSLPFLLPNTKILVIFEQIISTYFKQIKVIKSRNNILINIRNFLLPKLISGEIDL